ncbi:MAG: LON peptidase substrate-binding domain-containing protein [Gammaproteobacteria bacterium]
MSINPFIAPFEQLPATLPVFPLPGAIVMPGNELPLNIFEPRYLNMISDALSSHHMIGMIQPDPVAMEKTGLCQTGCAGRITQYRETNDGRIEMVLSGVCRYDVSEELPTTRGYRLIIPDWSRFPDDYADHDSDLRNEHDLLIHTLRSYFEVKDLEVDWSMLERLPTVRLLNSLSMALPLSEQSKQVLLETVKPLERLQTFAAMLQSELRPPSSATRH